MMTATTPQGYKLAPLDKHPVDDPNMPSYQCDSYREVLPDLNTAADLWKGQGAWMRDGIVRDLMKARKYLPQEEKEPDASYCGRVIRSPFNNKIKPAIKGLAGLLSSLSLGEEVLQSIKDAESNIDLRGNNLSTLLTYADEKVLADGNCGILVEFPRRPVDADGNPLIVDAETEQRFNLRPYLVLIDRRDILSWQTDYVGGNLVITQVAIRVRSTEQVGLFGTQEVIRYRIFTPGYFQVWEIVDMGNDKTEKVLVEEGPINDAKGRPLDRVPLIMYSATDANPFEAELPFINMMQLNIKYFQTESDYYEVLRKCNLPVPVRKGLIVPGQIDYSSLPPLELGPNSAVDVPADGDFYFREPSGAAIGASRQALQDIAEDMDRMTLSFLSSSDSSEKTATEIRMKSGQTQASVKSLATQKESMMEEVFDTWADYLGQEKGGTASIDKDLLQAPMQPDEIQAYAGLAERKQLSLATMLRILREGRALPKDLNEEEEVGRIQEDESRAIEAVQRAITAKAEITPVLPPAPAPAPEPEA